MLAFLRQIRCRYSNMLQVLYVQGQKPPDGRLCAPQNLKVEVIPNRGMRGMRSTVLHKEVVDKYRQKQQQDECEKAEIPSPSAAAPDDDMPVSGLPNPYEKPAKKCILCEHDVPLDYKNTRLLSQFVSPHTGRIYGRNTTGLCLFMQRRVAKLIKRSRFFGKKITIFNLVNKVRGLMPYEMKDPRYVHDPKLFDPFRRK